MPDVGWQDEQMIRAAAKFRAGPTGDIHRYGFMVFPDRTPAVGPISRWVQRLCTSADFAELREI